MKKIFLIFNNKFFLIFIFFLTLLISCTSKKSKNLSKDFYRNSSNNNFNNQSINLNNLRINLLKADNKLTPRLMQNNDGSYYYRYFKKPGEQKISLDEIKKRVLLGTEFYKKDRDKVMNLLIRINELKINNKLEHIKSGALGLWIPSKETIIIDYRVIEMGSPTFLDVLNHEVIHVAQSCFGGSRKKFPKRIGLPLEYSTDLNLNLSHNLYSKNSEEVLKLEREAFTYSKVDGMAIKLLNNFCE